MDGSSLYNAPKNFREGHLILVSTHNVFIFCSEVTVGFNPETYIVNEADGSVTLNVEVLEGTLERSVTVLFDTSPGSASEAGTYGDCTVSGLLGNTVVPE